MSGEKKPATNLEALTAEMLGEVYILHDKVMELKVELPAIVNSIRSVIAEFDNRVAEFDARAGAPEDAARKEIERFVRKEIAAMYHVNKADRQAALEILEKSRSETLAIFSNAIIQAVDNGVAGVINKGNGAFVDAANQFNGEISKSVGIAEGMAKTTLKNLCQTLRNETAMAQKSRWISMMGSCIVTGIIVGVAAIYLMKP